ETLNRSRLIPFSRDNSHQHQAARFRSCQTNADVLQLNSLSASVSGLAPKVVSEEMARYNGGDLIPARGAVPKWLREQSAKLRCSGSNPLGASIDSSKRPSLLLAWRHFICTRLSVPGVRGVSQQENLSRVLGSGFL